MKTSSKLVSVACASLLLIIILISGTAESVPQQGLPFPSPIQSMPCQRDQDCQSKFNDTRCGTRNVCECQKGFTEDNRRCLRVILDLNTECEINAQCAEGVGKHSRCSDYSHKCECFDTEQNGKRPTGFYGNTCYLRRSLGDRCDLREECRAGIGPAEDVRCDVKSRTCQCAEGKTCENLPGAATSVVTYSSLLISAVVAVKILA